MAYCELADLQRYLADDVIVSLADDDADGAADTDVITEVIAAADAEIDGFVSSQYATPFSSTPAVIKRCSAILAINYLYLRRSEAELPEKWDKEVVAVRKMLDNISRGVLQLGTAVEGSADGDYPAAARELDEATFEMGNDF